AVEAKENVAIERETRTYATITIQNYFRMYEKLSGMTGTAETEATEFHDIYKLDVVVIPTNKPCIRIDRNDSIFKSRRDKYAAVVREIEAANKRGQPALVGTVSVESSEVLSRMLKRAGVIHTVLNAKFHQQEAEIVMRAGLRGAVTIATNMAGRGTDIKLGEGVRELGGLCVIGTERHESRRIDRQLRGRCSRQGDPGLTKFFLSFEDELLRIFLSGGIASRMMEGTMKDGEELEHRWLNRSIESAQKKVEQQNFSQRKRSLQYDDVLNLQREVIYGIRNGAINAERAKDIIFEQVEEELATRLEAAGYGGKGTSPAAIESFVTWVNAHFPIGLKAEELTSHDLDSLAKQLIERIKQAYTVKEAAEPPEALGMLERYIVISAIDHHWQEHLTELEDLRKHIGLRGYGQKDPLVEYKNEAYSCFAELMDNVRLQICTNLFRRRIGWMQAPEAPPPAPNGAVPPPPPPPGPTVTSRITFSGGAAEAPPSSSQGEKEIKLPSVTIRRDLPKVGRNDPCPCGSGKKYKQCHGA
ncbi:MAG TPA: SEC-C metal-binding domain-containing protein, partial [Opitutaceae bacterium]|nr:SEC-C metal-binding domain-containing protein [Opitutaceae bacterium]